MSLTASAERAPDAPPVITRKDWCVHGTPTRTTGDAYSPGVVTDVCVPRSQRAGGLPAGDVATPGGQYMLHAGLVRGSGSTH